MHCFREFSLPVLLRKSLVDKENPKIACWIMDVFGNFREPLRLFFCTKGTKGNSYDGYHGYNQDFDFWFVVLCSFSGPSRRGDFRRGGSELFVRSVRGGTLQAAWIGASPLPFATLRQCIESIVTQLRTSVYTCWHPKPGHQQLQA